jgi:hypothetical protein
MPLSFVPVLSAIVILGQPQADDAAPNAVREEQMRFLKQKSTELSLFRPPDSKTPLPLWDRAALHYSNPVGLSSDGAMFLWLAGKRPVAAVSFSLRRPNNAVYRECTSLWSTSLDCRQDGASVWSPKKGGLLAQRFKDAPAPAESQVRRLAQMRDISRRFAVTWHHSRTDERTELQILPTPLYRFAAEQEGILDGTLFAFVVTNDPEMLLLLEAARDKPDEPAYWRYSLARMSSLKEVVRLDDQEIWTVPHYHSDPQEDKLTGHYTEQRVGTFAPGGGPPAGQAK